MPTVRLSNERRDLAEQWIPAAYKFARRAQHVYGMSEEDAEMTAFDALLRAAAAWDPAKAKFSTYLWKSLYIAFPHAMRMRSQRHEKALAAGGAEIGLYSHEHPVPDRPRRQTITGTIEDLDAILATGCLDHDPRYEAILRMRASGIGLKECGTALGLTKERVRQLQMKATSRILADPRARIAAQSLRQG